MYTQDPNFPQYKRDNSTGRLQAVGAKPKRQPPQTAQEFGDRFIQVLPKVTLWCVLILIVLPIVVTLILVGAMIIL